jgi:hypothetical protein
MKRILVLATLVAFSATAVASAHHSSATLVIRHQLRGCHSWSLNGDAFKPSQSGRFHAGAILTVTDNDVMPHRLVQTSGPKVFYTGSPAMKHIGASVKVLFTQPGTYTFTTKAGEDYMKGVKTIGEDNVLRLRILVSR